MLFSGSRRAQLSHLLQTLLSTHFVALLDSTTVEGSYSETLVHTVEGKRADG